MFDYLLERLTFFHNEMLNESNIEIRKCLISLVRSILSKLPEEFEILISTYDQ